MSDSILLISDEDLVSALIRSTLAGQGRGVRRVRSAREARALLDAERFDAVIVDALPDRDDELDLLAALTPRRSTPPVLVLTASSDVRTRVRALELGADDSLAKPFEVTELSARVRALLRRGRPVSHAQDATTLRFGDCEIDFVTRAARARAQRVVLSEREAGLMRLLAQAGGRPVTRAEILGALWGPGARSSARTVDNMVLRLRKIFEPDVARPRHLLTVRGVGYRFVAEPAAAEPDTAAQG